MLNPHTLVSVGRRELFQAAGTAWTADTRTQKLLELLGEYREQSLADQLQLRSQVIQRRSIANVQSTARLGFCSISVQGNSFLSANHNGQVLKVSDAIASIDRFLYNDVEYEQGRDYRQKNNTLLFAPHVPPLIRPQLEAFGVVVRTYYLENFWSNVFAYRDVSPGSDRFYRALHELARTRYSVASLVELLGAAVGVEVVRTEGTVQAANKPDSSVLSPIVVTNTQTLHGQIADEVTVAVGDQLYPGDTVFDSLRFHDCVATLPAWLTSLNIPPRLFKFAANSPVTVTSVQQPPAGVTTVEGRVHIKIPVSGEPAAVEAFHAAMVEQEQASGVTLAQFLFNRQNVTEAEALALNLDWLDVLWSTWLRYGVSVSVVRDKPSNLVLQRLSQVRRVTPPWFTHIVHFLQPPDNQNDIC